MNENTTHAQAFVTATGEQKLLLVNKQAATTELHLPAELQGWTAEVVDVSTGGNPWRNETVAGGLFDLMCTLPLS